MARNIYTVTPMAGLVDSTHPLTYTVPTGYVFDVRYIGMAVVSGTPQVAVLFRENTALIWLEEDLTGPGFTTWEGRVAVDEGDLILCSTTTPSVTCYVTITGYLLTK